MRILYGVIIAVAAAVGVWLLAARSHQNVTDDESVYRADGRYVGPARAKGKRPNLVVIMIDTLRADCVGERGQMPYLMKLAGQGVHCTRVTSPAPSTYPSITSFLTGLLPDEHRVDHTPDPPTLPGSITTFAEALGRGHGYETAAFLQVRLSGGANAPLQGFGTVRAAAPLHAWRGSIESWNAARPKSAPYFLFLHTYEAHDPYGEGNHPWPEGWPTPDDVARAKPVEGLDDAELVETFLTDRGVRVKWLEDGARRVFDRVFHYFGRGYAQAPDPAMAGRLERAYRGGVGWVDSQLEACVEHLRTEGLLEDALLVVTSDHGEAFGEHGILNHGRALYSELVHVPLVAVGPAPFSGGREVETSFGLIDLIPTFFDMAGLPQVQDVTGRSVLADIEKGGPGRAVLSIEDLTTYKLGRFANVKMASARTATESYIVSYDVAEGTIVEELYDLSKDPREQHDLIAATGRVGDRAVGPRLAAAIERARDRIWGSVEASQSHLQTGYGSGVATVSEERPPVPRVR